MDDIDEGVRVNRSRGVLALTVAVCAIALVLSGGCSGTSEAPAVVDDVSAPEEVSEPAPEPVFDPSAGPILGMVNPETGQLESVEQIDPSTGESTVIGSFTSSAEAAPTFSPWGMVHLSGWYFEQSMDPQLDLLAVNLEPTSDGSRHVGWIDSSGALMDVTEQMSSTTSDFAALPQQGNALFDASGNFVYVDYTTKQLNRVDPDTMSPVGVPVDVGNQYGNIPYSVMLQPDDSVDTYQSDRLSSTGMVVDFLLPGGKTLTSFSDASIQDLVGDDSVLVRWREWSGGSTSTTLKVVGAGDVEGGDTENAGDVPAITPVTDWLIQTACVSGDGQRVAFSATRGEEQALFVVPSDGSSEPVRLLDMPPSALLLFWK